MYAHLKSKKKKIYVMYEKRYLNYNIGGKKLYFNQLLQT